MRLELDFLKFEPKLRIKPSMYGGHVIYDPIRRKDVVLTPEELLRQMVCLYLTEQMGYPANRIRTEIGIDVNEMPRRCDIVVFDAAVQPWMVIECKSPKVPVNQAVMDQAVMYNLTLLAPYMMVTNGLDTYCVGLDHEERTYDFLPSLPPYGPVMV
jgi:hypothetical protein